MEQHRRDERIAGLHHVALVSADLERSRDFYERVLGLHFHGEGAAPVTVARDPSALHELRAHWYGDTDARPGSLIAVIGQPHAPQGAPGIGGSHHFALCVADRDVLLRWKRRMIDNGYTVNGILDRHYFQSIYVKDPDGQIVELATRGPGWTMDEPEESIGTTHRLPPAEMVNTNRDRARIAAENWPDAVAEVTPDMAIQGLHHVTAIGADMKRTEAFVGETLGMRRVKWTSNFDDIDSYHCYWGAGMGAPGTLVTYFERRPEREGVVRQGVGQLSHYALAAPGDAFEVLREQLTASAAAVSPTRRFEAPGTRGETDGAFDAFATIDPDGHAVVITSI